MNSSPFRSSLPCIATCLAASLLSIAAWVVLPVPLRAQMLSINPTRLVLEARQRSAEVLLLNQGLEETTYRIFFKRMRMTETGAYEDIEEPRSGELFADSIIRYAPRRVTLAPNSSQTVRLLVRKPRDLSPGEYRSHLVFQSVPPPDMGTAIDSNLGKDEIAIRLIRILSISIPVIVRHGKLEASASISDAEVTTKEVQTQELISADPQAAEQTKEPGKPKRLLALTLHRQGNRSLIGDFSVTFEPSLGEAVEVGQLAGVALYVPTPKRRVEIELIPPEGIVLVKGALRVVYRARPEEDNRVLAEGTVALP